MKKLVITFLMIAMVLNLCGCAKKGLTIIADTGDSGTRSYDHFRGNEFNLHSPSYASGDLHYVYKITFTE